MAAPAQHVAAVRAFNRFYTRQVGALGEHRLVRRTASPADARRNLVHLTRRGRIEFAPYEERTRNDVGALLGRLSTTGQRQVVDAMQTIQRALATPPAAPAYVLRPHQPGDMGWVVQRHGELYAREWGYNAQFEALVARIAADFLDRFDPVRERCWIAEKDGERVGSVFLVKHLATVAKLRMLIVDPHARGLGIGRRLVDQCVRFARQAGYRKITLWTHSQLKAARAIYQQAGFRCVHTQANRCFGRKLVDETWDLLL
ncbi:MAG: hypothetical protein AUI11_00510 [Acidobacteria bacterium 13_2_20CM_2_66_4]|nr:MAG: hypothetical protein AUI11_00510 [Acidobacteria bacterium 13_2_20CM_2_66_4]